MRVRLRTRSSLRKRQRAEGALLDLPHNVLKLVMESLVRLHATPTPLLRFLHTTNQLCKPGFQLHDIVVKPFVLDHRKHLVRMHDHFWSKYEKERANVMRGRWRLDGGSGGGPSPPAATHQHGGDQAHYRAHVNMLALKAMQMSNHATMIGVHSRVGDPANAGA